jgi:choline-glycine betaine transporter
MSNTAVFNFQTLLATKLYMLISNSVKISFYSTKFDSASAVVENDLYLQADGWNSESDRRIKVLKGSKILSLTSKLVCSAGLESKESDQLIGTWIENNPQYPVTYGYGTCNNFVPD